MENSTRFSQQIDFDTFIEKGSSREVYKDFIIMNVAIVLSQCSTAKRMKCGSVLLRDGYTISSGYNGTMPGESNICENDDFTTNNSITIHAEQNCLSFADTSIDGYYTLYITHMPCEECMKLCILKRINEIVYSSDYRGKRDYVNYAKKFIKIRKTLVSMKSIYGIYLDEELVYIGSSIRPIDRWDTHITYLSAKKHANKILQEKYNTSDNKDINITILKYCPFDTDLEMRNYEHQLIKKYKPPCNQQFVEGYSEKIMSGIIKRRKDGKNFKDISLEDIYRLSRSGKSIREISILLSCSESTIRRRIGFMKKNGYDV